MTTEANDRSPSAPIEDVDSAPYWDAARRGEFVLQHCDACDDWQFPPRVLCVRCGGPVAWRAASGHGTIYSLTVVERAPQEFADRVPFAVVLVDLTEGVRMIGNVLGAPAASVAIGNSVRVVFEDLGGGVVLPQFALEE